MAKKGKGKRLVSDDLKNAFSNAGVSADGGIDMDKLEELSDEAYNSMSENDRDIFIGMMHLAMSGVTPEDYARFHEIFEISGMIASKFDDNSHADRYEPGFSSSRSSGKRVKEYEPFKDAGNKTLVLKVKMKGVTKPPMWREVEVPADFNFLQLHEVIQEIVGLDDYHLWQFNKEAYREDLIIGIEGDEDFGGGVDHITHDAEETPLSCFLQKKGDKLEYVYDFGDDWIFIVEVKEVKEKKSTTPVCTKYKGELNAIEDFGGIYGYLSAREDMEDWLSLSAKERKKRALDRGFDSAEEYRDFLMDHMMLLDDVNGLLIGI